MARRLEEMDRKHKAEVMKLRAARSEERGQQKADKERKKTEKKDKKDKKEKKQKTDTAADEAREGASSSRRDEDRRPAPFCIK